MPWLSNRGIKLEAQNSYLYLLPPTSSLRFVSMVLVPLSIGNRAAPIDIKVCRWKQWQRLAAAHPTNRTVATGTAAITAAKATNRSFGQINGKLHFEIPHSYVIGSSPAPANQQALMFGAQSPASKTDTLPPYTSLGKFPGTLRTSNTTCGTKHSLHTGAHAHTHTHRACKQSKVQQQRWEERWAQLESKGELHACNFA